VTAAAALGLLSLVGPDDVFAAARALPAQAPGPAAAQAAGPAAGPAGQAPAPVASGGKAAARNVFLSGHSLINLDMPWNVQQIAGANGHGHYYNAQIGIGANLQVRAAGGNEQDASGKKLTFKALDEIRSPKTVPAGGKYDALVITEASEIAHNTLFADSVKHATTFHAAMMAGNPQAQVFLYDSWDDTKKDVRAWITKTREDHHWYQCIASAVNKDPGRARNPIRLLPAGVMLARLAEAIEAGKVPGLKAPNVLFHSDGHHASHLGNYVLAMSVYSTLYGRKPELPPKPTTRDGRPYDGLPPAATLAALRDLVWTIAQDTERAGQKNRRAMAECRHDLPVRCGTMGRFVCRDRVNQVFAD
jgi:hypothetical protein